MIDWLIETFIQQICSKILIYSRMKQVTDWMQIWILQYYSYISAIYLYDRNSESSILVCYSKLSLWVSQWIMHSVHSITLILQEWNKNEWGIESFAKPVCSDLFINETSDSAYKYVSESCTNLIYSITQIHSGMKQAMSESFSFRSVMSLLCEMRYGWFCFCIIQ